MKIKLILIQFLSFMALSNCGQKVENLDEVSKAITVPNTPTELSLTNPASSPGSDTTPTITVNGVETGDTVKLFTDTICSVEVGSALSTGTSVSIASSTLASASYTFYANTTRNAVASDCSTANITYEIIACPTGYIVVPSMPTVGATNDFCVMKYEAKDSGGQAVSTAENSPWLNINQIDAKAKCQSLGANYDLISNPEWMAIARNIENMASNWTGASVGSGCIKRGNVGDTHGCSGGDSAYDGSDPEFGTNRNTLASLSLDNGEVIWDLSGNVWEWVDWTLGGSLSTNMSQANKPSQGGTPVDLKIEFTLLDTFSVLAPSDSILPEDSSFNASQGVGRYQAGGSGGAARRGGDSPLGTHAGVFALSLRNPSTLQASYIGFRCVFRP